MLTMEQKEMLRAASSGFSPDSFSKLDKDTQEHIAARIDKVVELIHSQNPEKFVFTYDKKGKLDKIQDLLERQFYHAPSRTTLYKSAKVTKILWPEFLEKKL